MYTNHLQPSNGDSIKKSKKKNKNRHSIALPAHRNNSPPLNANLYNLKKARNIRNIHRTVSITPEHFHLRNRFGTVFERDFHACDAMHMHRWMHFIANASDRITTYRCRDVYPGFVRFHRRLTCARFHFYTILDGSEVSHYYRFQCATCAVDCLRRLYRLRPLTALQTVIFVSFGV